jgi:hypothetical protein
MHRDSLPYPSPRFPSMLCCTRSTHASPKANPVCIGVCTGETIIVRWCQQVADVHCASRKASFKWFGHYVRRVHCEGVRNVRPSDPCRCVGVCCHRLIYLKRNQRARACFGSRKRTHLVQIAHAAQQAIYIYTPSPRGPCNRQCDLTVCPIVYGAHVWYMHVRAAPEGCGQGRMRPLQQAVAARNEQWSKGAALPTSWHV